MVVELVVMTVMRKVAMLVKMTALWMEETKDVKMVEQLV